MSTARNTHVPELSQSAMAAVAAWLLSFMTAAASIFRRTLPDIDVDVRSMTVSGSRGWISFTVQPRRETKPIILRVGAKAKLNQRKTLSSDVAHATRKRGGRKEWKAVSLDISFCHGVVCPVQELPAVAKTVLTLWTRKATAAAFILANGETLRPSNPYI